VLIIGVLIFLIILAVYSVISFEIGHWFREKLWIFYEIVLIGLGVHGILSLDPLAVILTALPFLSHLWWMKMSKRYGSKPYKWWVDAFWPIDVGGALVVLLVKVVQLGIGPYSA
jgi:hypothetical protein